MAKENDIYQGQSNGLIDWSSLANRPQQVNPQSQEGFNPASLLPTGGGIGGALGGAAAGAGIGSLIFPGVGTAIGGLIGGIAGGAGGSAIGKVGENAIEQKPLDTGVANEALMGGIFSAPPLRLAKGLGAAGKVILGGTKAAEAAGGKTAAEAFAGGLTGAGVLNRAGAELRGSGRGITVGDKVNGVQLTPDKAKQLNSFIENTIGAKGLTAAKQLENVGTFITKRSDQLSQVINTSNRALSRAEKTALADQITKQFGNIIDPTTRQGGILNDIITRISAAKDIKSLDQLRKIIDDGINFSRNPSAAEPAAEQVYRLARKALTTDVAAKIPGAKAIKSDLSNALDVQDLLLNKAGGTTGYGRAGSGGASLPIPAGATQSGETLLGRALGATGKANAGIAGTGFTPGGVIGRQVIGQGIAGAGQPTESSQLSGGLDTQQFGQSMSGLGGQDLYGMNQPQQTNPYPQQNLLYDIQRDPANADKYIAYYQQLQQVFAPQAQTSSFSKPSAQLHSQAVTGLNSIDQLEQMLSSNSDLANKAAVPGQDLPIVGGLVSSALGTNQYKAAANNILNSIARINTGAAMPASEESFYNRTYLPQPGDNQATIQAKIQQLRAFFDPIANYNQYSQGQDTSLQDALLQAQGGY